jgi:hypothetical protein
MAVQLSDVTEVSLEGNGSFDAFMRVLRLHINDAIAKNEITQQEAGAVYTGVIPSMIQEAVRFELGIDLANKDLEIKDAQLKNEQDKLLTSAKQRDVMSSQEKLYNRQRAGFDDNKHQKILEAQMNAWGITFQDTDTTFIPAQISQTGSTTEYPSGTFGFNQAFENVITDYYSTLD